MRKSVLLVVVIFCLALGLAGGYALAIVESASTSPFLGRLTTQEKGFDRVISDFAQLGGYESVAANCNGVSDIHAAIKAETRALFDLQELKLVDPNLLSVAQAKLLLRAVDNGEKGAGYGDRSSNQNMESVLGSAGWMNPSRTHMQDIVSELDHDQCRLVVLGGKQ